VHESHSALMPLRDRHLCTERFTGSNKHVDVMGVGQNSALDPLAWSLLASDARPASEKDSSIEMFRR